MTDLTIRAQETVEPGQAVAGVETLKGSVVGAYVAPSVKLKSSVIWAYVAPAVGNSYMGLLVGLYLMKFSTDVLLIAPAIMGTVFGISSIGDAIADPVVGFLSDRTQTRLGRRRPWLLLSILPIAGTFIWVFSPPAFLAGNALVVWMVAGVILFSTADSIFYVPHMSLGAELTPNYHERSRVFGFLYSAQSLGSILGLVGLQVLIVAEQRSDAAHDPSIIRTTAFHLSVLAALITAGLIGYAVVKLRERADYLGRKMKHPFDAFKDVWNNPHARLLIFVSIVGYIGTAAINLLTLYVCAYVVGRPELAPSINLSFIIIAAISPPLCIPLSRRFGKIPVLMFSTLLYGLSFGAMFSLPFLPPTARVYAIFALAAVAGLAGGCSGTISPSMQSDIIDYDEYTTGERKEGSYFAAFMFISKCASGVMVLVTGYVLQFSGFVPNQAPTMTVQIAIMSLFSLVPLVCAILSTWMLSRFSLDEAAHNTIRVELERRAAGSVLPS